MKRLSRSCLLLTWITVLTPILAQDTESYTNATSVKVKIYKLALSTNADCSNPITIFENNSPGQSEMVNQQPNLGKGKVTPKTYNCAIVEIAKNVSTMGAPSCPTVRVDSICPDTWQSQLTNGSGTFQCTGGTGNDQRIAIYFTTNGPDNPDTRKFLPPLNGSDNTSGIKPTGPIVISSSVKVALKVVTQNMIRVTGACAAENIQFKLAIQ